MMQPESQLRPKLTRLDLHGFKSFATKTTFRFESGIIAVVGPNGSGKSNIADAIRWVLGETSHSALRSKKTEDVIFAGGKGRAPSGMAEVTVTFDNDDRWLPSEFAEIAVTRRAFRGGGGEYLINGRKVRLKDVAQLVASLGHSYTVVGQGLVDAALSQRAEDRRGLFEHAADLTGLRLRVAEGERNLAETDTNVTRLRDLLSQVEPNLKRLERAARQQKEWKALRDRQIFLQRGHYRRLLVAATASLTSAESRVTATKKEMETAQSSLEALIASRPDLEAELQAATHQLELQDTRLTELRTRLAEINHRKEIVEERIGALERRAGDADATRSAMMEQMAHTTSRLEAATAAHTESEQQTTAARTAVDQQRLTVQAMQQERAAAEQQLATTTRDALAIERRITGLQQQQALLEQRQETSGSDRERRLTESRELAERLKQLVIDLTEYERSHIELNRQLNHLSDATAGLNSDLASANTNVTELRTRRTELERNISRANSRLEVLQRMHEAGEGLYQGPRSVIQWRNAGQLKGIRGTLAEVISVAPRFDVALEMALGGHLQDIVVDTWDDAEAAIRKLQQAKSGRATFQPIETIRRRNGHRPPPADLVNASGVHGIASDLIECDDDIRVVVQALLGRFVVVDDLATSRRLLDSLPGGWSTVTLIGEISRSGGSITGGSQGRDSGVLARERELRELPEQISALTDRLNDIDTSLPQHIAALEQLQADYRENANRQAEISAQLKALEPQRTRLQQWIEEVRRNQERAIREDETATTTAHEREAEIESLSQQITTLQGQLAEAREHELSIRSNLADRQADAQEQADTLAEANTALAALEERFRAEDREIRQLQSQLHVQQTELNARENDQADISGRRIALGEELKRLQQELSSVQGDLEQATTKREPLTQSLTTAADALRIRQDEIETARQHTMDHERSSGQQELILERERATHSAIQRRITDDLNLENPIELLAQTEDQDFSDLPEDHDETELEIGRLRSRLHRVGYVSDNVVEEYEEEAERFAFLTEQLADVEQAASRLRSMLAELHDTMQTRFEETFEEVSIAFSEAFTTLFGGGQARLVLTADDDGAPGGVDIVAQPPGKRLQGLALLSGGERSLTGVALLFAILRVNPTPFVLLDEVDAALDEENVVRFRDELRTLASQTQAIVITHNRGTVEIADVLYGITMGGDGVSQTLSLRLDDLPIDEDFDVRDLQAVATGIPVR